MIEVYTPEIGKDEKLPNQVKPHGWEHLAGPFSWCEPTANSIQESEEDGLYLPVEVKNNTMGTLARHFQQHGKIAHSNILFVGPPGNGKSAVEKFLAWVHLSEEHVPVTYQLDDGEKVTLVDDDTGEPFVINPTNTGTITYDFVDRKLSESVEPHEISSTTRIQLHNAGPLSKSDVDELITDLKKDLSMLGRRVVVLSEIHDFTNQQTRSLKTELDPANMSEGLLVMGDANSKAKAESALGDAGMERFEVVSASRWHQETLEFYAREYLDHYQIQFDNSFEDPPEMLLARRANGSIRQLLFLIQKVRDATQPISPEDLRSLFEKDVDESDTRKFGQDLWRFENKVVHGNMSASAFVTNMITRNSSVHGFLSDLAFQVSTNYGQMIEDREASKIMVELREACHYTLHEARPIDALIWSSIAEPLSALADLMQEYSK